jgi:hypothetical protein
MKISLNIITDKFKADIHHVFGGWCHVGDTVTSISEIPVICISKGCSMALSAIHC